MALLNRFSRLNDRGETGVFTFIVTKSVTRDFHRDATTKDFCFGYHRWAVSFQRPSEKQLGVHLLLRNPSPSTACVVDFTLTLLNRRHFSKNQVYTKRQAKFTITNPMQGVSRWIQVSELVEQHFSNETGEFLFELSLSNVTTIFECDIQLSGNTLAQYKAMLKHHFEANTGETGSGGSNGSATPAGLGPAPSAPPGPAPLDRINLETNYFTFGSFDWSLTIVPHINPPKLLVDSSDQVAPHRKPSNASSWSGTSRGEAEPVCRVYLNRLTGLDNLCRVKYRVILGHHQPPSSSSSASQPGASQFADSKTLDQISDTGGRIRGYQFRNTNVLKLISLRSSDKGQSAASAKDHHNASHQHQHRPYSASALAGSPLGPGPGPGPQSGGKQSQSASNSLDLRVHIEMFCANTVSEARVPLHRKPNEAQVGNCSDRNKQTWCIEADSEGHENVRLKLFFLDLQSVPRNHIRYISWIAYVVRRDPKSGQMSDSLCVRNSPHSNYYLQDGIDMGTIMDTDIATSELTNSPQSYLDATGKHLTVHVEWVDSLLLFSHLYNNSDSLATVQRHQISRELAALQDELAILEEKYDESRTTINQLLAANPSAAASLLVSPLEASGQRQRQISSASSQSASSESPSSPGVGGASSQLCSLVARQASVRSKLQLVSELGAGGADSAPMANQERRTLQQMQTSRASASMLPASQFGVVEQITARAASLQQQQHPFEGGPSAAGIHNATMLHNSQIQLAQISLDSSSAAAVASNWPTSHSSSSSSSKSAAIRTLSNQQHWPASKPPPTNQPGGDQQPAAPMSLDERLKFSSSTPPSTQNHRHQLRGASGGGAATLGASASLASSAFTASQRRRQLPQKPSIRGSIDGLSSGGFNASYNNISVASSNESSASRQLLVDSTGPTGALDCLPRTPSRNPILGSASLSINAPIGAASSLAHQRSLIDEKLLHFGLEHENSATCSFDQSLGASVDDHPPRLGPQQQGPTPTSHFHPQPHWAQIASDTNEQMRRAGSNSFNQLETDLAESLPDPTGSFIHRHSATEHLIQARSSFKSQPPHNYNQI